MFRIIYILNFICCTLCLQAESEIYEKVQKKYKNLKTFKAEVTSEVVISEAVKFNLKGSICFKGKTTWKVRMLKDKEVIFYNLADEQHHWVLDKKNKRVIKSLRQKEQQAPMRFFPAFDQYDSTKIKVLNTEDFHTLELPFKKKDGPFRFIKLKISKKDQVIQQMSFLDAKKKVGMKITFSAVAINRELKKTDFTYEPIKDIELKTIKE